MVGLECVAPLAWAAVGSVDLESGISVGKGESAILQGSEVGLS